MKADIIGGGVVGLCSAYFLARDGHDVTVYDPADGPRTSTINAGMIVPSHVIPLASPGMVGVGMRMLMRPKSPFWIRPRLSRDLLRWCLLFARHCTPEHVARAKPLLASLNLASKQLYLDFRRELPGFEIEEKGLLMIAKEGATLEEERQVAAQVRELGLPATELDGAQVASFDPGVRIKAAGGVHYPADCHFSPPQFMSLLQGKLAEIGVQFVPGHWNPSQGRDLTVLAAGAWSGGIAKGLGLDLPLQAGKGYSFNVESPPERPSIAAILMEGRVAVTPMPQGVRFGGTMEIGPPDARVDNRRVQGIRGAIPSYYPAFRGCDLSSGSVAIGLRPCSPDGLPYIGTSGDGFIVATGHAMMGMSLGPITGRLVADLAAGREPSVDISALRPDRFSRASKLPA